MQKSEVELIIAGVNAGKEQALNVKIYRDGTLTRSGCGGLPPIAVSGMTVEGTQEYWNELIGMIDERIIANPVNHQDEKIDTPLEYFIAFFGVSKNGETGERAEWTKSSGVRFLLDSNTAFRHPLLGFLDQFVIKAAEVTNPWFFDVMMSAIYNLKPAGLENTFVTVPKTEAEKQEALSRYVNQIMANAPRGWNIVDIGNGRKYLTPDGKEVTSRVENNGGSVSINFYQQFDKDNLAAADKTLREILESEEVKGAKAGARESSLTPAAQPGKEEPKTTKPSKKWWEIWK